MPFMKHLKLFCIEIKFIITNHFVEMSFKKHFVSKKNNLDY